MSNSGTQKNLRGKRTKVSKKARMAVKNPKVRKQSASKGTFDPNNLKAPKPFDIVGIEV